MKKSVPIRLLLVVSSFALLLFEISSIYSQHAQQPWIESGPDKGFWRDTRNLRLAATHWPGWWRVIKPRLIGDRLGTRRVASMKNMIYASCGLLIWRKIESFVHWALRSVMFGPEVIAHFRLT
jgi:hypothetical protein